MKSLLASQSLLEGSNETQRHHKTLPFPTTASAQPFHHSFDEADSEGAWDPNVYVSTNTSFSNSFMEHNAPKSLIVDAISIATIKQQPNCNPEKYKSPRTICSELKNSIWANPWKSSNVNDGDDVTGVSRATKTASRNNYPKASHPPSRSLSREVQSKPGATARDLHRKVVVSGLKASCSLCRVLEQVRGGLIVEAILVNTTSITGTKSVVVSFFEER